MLQGVTDKVYKSVVCVMDTWIMLSPQTGFERSASAAVEPRGTPARSNCSMIAVTSLQQ
ncbi:hypothetical protein LSTR_LSTR004469 [Laodelphax striatellus]|uniref:Uncharacterized protein n=1 Tax=Laodelphax striatellus TaxID=195883 RepID=A0A482XEH5_LAOST|nr:hypothetical protein LSTR_LSTR004469 [Laodelphax striatellus]